MSIIKKYNKANDTTYVYDSVSYWDKEKQQPRSKRKLIGKLDPVTGEIIPTAGRGRKPKPVSDSVLKGTPQEDDSSETIVAIPDIPVDADYRALYEDSRKQLLETEARLAKVESTLARYTAEKQDLARQLEQLARQLRL